MASSATTIVYDYEQSCQLHAALGVMDQSYKLYPDARYADSAYEHKPLEASDTKMVLSLGIFPKQSTPSPLCGVPAQALSRTRGSLYIFYQRARYCPASIQPQLSR